MNLKYTPRSPKLMRGVLSTKRSVAKSTESPGTASSAGGNGIRATLGDVDSLNKVPV